MFLQENNETGANHSCLVSTQDCKLYVVGQDTKLKEVVKGAMGAPLDTGHTLSHLAIPHGQQRILFAGTENGIVKAFKLPLTPVCTDHAVHRCVSRVLCLSVVFVVHCGYYSCL